MKNKHRHQYSAISVLSMLLIAVAILIGSAAVRASGKNSPNGRPVPFWGTDINVNTVPADNHEAFSLDYNPNDPNKVIAGFKYEDANGKGSGYAYSATGGSTWTGGSFTGPWGQDVLTPSGNTSVGYNAAGVAFLASRAESDQASGYFVLTSTDGANWSTPVAVVTTTLSEVRDQARLAVDHRASGTNAGSAYLAWHYSPANDVGVFVSASHDNGATWSQGVLVSDKVNNYSSHPVPVVASDGSIYVASMQLDNGCYCNPPRLLVDHSTDGGATWGVDHIVTGAPISQTGALDKEGHDLVIRGSDTPEAGVEVNNFPVMAVSPSNPNVVYVAWNDGRWDTDFEVYGHTGRHGDIAFSRSTDGGVTWSAPVRVNDDAIGNGIDQFMPAIAVGTDGTIGITWYDRRMNPGAYLYDVFYSQSTDGGLTWSRNQRVSDESSDPMVGANSEGVGDLGEYRSMIVAPTYVLPAWLDSRNGETQEFYVDKGDSPSCIVTFTDVQSTDYFYQAVEYLSCHGVISGYADNTFRPYANTTRGQLSKIIVLAEGWTLQNPATGHFTDVAPGSAFYAYVETAYAHGIISGYADGTFRPGANVTRGQLSKIVVSAEGWTITTPSQPTFSDVPASDPFYGFIETAYAHSIISGYADGTFRPGANATRGQISKIVYNAVTAP